MAHIASLTVSQLIDLLQSYPPNLPVTVIADGQRYPVCDVYDQPEDVPVFGAAVEIDCGYDPLEEENSGFDDDEEDDPEFKEIY